MEGFARIDAAFDELRAGGLDVADDEVQPLERPWRRGTDAIADRDRARRAGRRHLYVSEVVAGPVVDVEAEAQLVGVEVLRAVDVRGGDDHELQLPVHVFNPPVEPAAVPMS